MSGSFEKLLGHGDLPKVVLRHSSGSSAEVYSFGATVTSYKTAAAKEVLFLSESSAFDGKKAIRGGIPLVFPQFGQPSKAMASHGFTRTSNFDLAETKTEGDVVKAVFELSDSEATRAVWPFPFRLSYTIALAADSLRTSLDIHNTGTHSFDAQALLHTYYRVDDVRQVSVHGFRAKRFLDKVDVTEGDLPTEDRDGAVVEQEVDRIYHTGNHHVTLRESAADKVAIELSAVKTGTDGGRTPLPTNCVFWNPWVQKAKALSDLHDDEYMNFVCIEPGVVASPFNLGPGESLTLEQHLRPT